MIALLAVHRLMGIARVGEGIGGKLVIGAFDFLQHQHVGLKFARKSSTMGRRRRTELMFQVTTETDIF